VNNAWDALGAEALVCVPGSSFAAEAAGEQCLGCSWRRSASLRSR
jgi:hypothetical protein